MGLLMSKTFCNSMFSPSAQFLSLIFLDFACILANYFPFYHCTFSFAFSFGLPFKNTLAEILTRGGGLIYTQSW